MAESYCLTKTSVNLSVYKYFILKLYQECKSPLGLSSSKNFFFPNEITAGVMFSCFIWDSLLPRLIIQMKRL